mmetsp:Transcript_14736/g.32018  ORF Transcript_14736/g.32018 Transcript_14736/m.32018 type:complete len:171 (+) Transcript_14736:268-780(+)
MKQLAFAAIALLLLLLSMFPSHTSGYSSSSPRDGDQRTVAEVERHVLGGYSDADVRSERIVAAARYAVAALQKGVDGAPPPIELYSFSEIDTDGLDVVILEAQQQVVAGMNYRIKIGLTDSHGKCLGAFKVLVYDQFGDLSVSRWGEEVPCGEMELAIEAGRKQEQDEEV